MQHKRLIPAFQEIEQKEQRNIAKVISEIQWIVLMLVVFFLAMQQHILELSPMVMGALGCYLVFIIFSYVANLGTKQFHWKLTLETLFMIFFVTWMIWHTGKINSPLIMLYALIIIISALNLSKLTSLLQVVLIGMCMLMLGVAHSTLHIFTSEFTTEFVVYFVPLLLVAYLTTMIASHKNASRQQLKSITDIDKLTKLHNMRGFFDIIENELARCARYDRKFSVLMIDIDNFEGLNTQYDKKVGDKMLCHVSSQLRSLLRMSDIVARYGNDVFVALLIETDEQGAENLANKVCKSISNTPLEWNNQSIPVSVSTGHACFPSDADDIHHIISKAEQVMLTRKPQKTGQESDARPASDDDLEPSHAS